MCDPLELKFMMSNINSNENLHIAFLIILLEFVLIVNLAKMMDCIHKFPITLITAMTVHFNGIPNLISDNILTDEFNCFLYISLFLILLF